MEGFGNTIVDVGLDSSVSFAGCYLHGGYPNQSLADFNGNALRI